MTIVIISLRYHDASKIKAYIASLKATGTFFLTDTLYPRDEHDKRFSAFPEGKNAWYELPRPGDWDAMLDAIACGADILYRYPSTKQRRIFVRKTACSASCASVHTKSNPAHHKPPWKHLRANNA